MSANEQSSTLLGNHSLVSNEEGAVADALRERYLAYTNEISQPAQPRNTFYTRVVKRLLDILISLPIVLITLPFNLIFAVCTFFDVGRPLLYKQSRCGKDGKPFVMAKFRNMNNNTDENGKLLPAAQRVTRFGKFMRKFSLDELLNFWNVLIGDMSIIGPRPVPMFFDERMSDRHKQRNAVRPGLECPRVFEPQGKDGKELSAYHTKFENDIWYVEHVSFATDVKMVFKLIQMTFSMKKRGAHASHASYFVGYDKDGEATSLACFKKQYPQETAEILSSAQDVQ